MQEIHLGEILLKFQNYFVNCAYLAPNQNIGADRVNFLFALSWQGMTVYRRFFAMLQNLV